MYRPTKSGKEESMNDEYSQIAEDGKLWWGSCVRMEMGDIQMVC
jgi:hypothetical protein